MFHQAVFNTSEVCVSYGVRHVVLSPGSRNAPLTVSFVRNDRIKKWIVPDERSAAFIALGIAQKLEEPVALCCTSGTALLNYGPAVAEAFYREIPLLVFSADRPPELVDQRDGQTIRQHQVLNNHVRASTTLPLVTDDSSSAQYLEELDRVLERSLTLPRGPVHINVPFREPFYPDADQKLEFDTIEPKSTHTQKTNAVELDLPEYEKILILVGQGNPDLALSKTLQRLSKAVPVMGSPLSNLRTQSLSSGDFWISSKPDLRPDLLLTTGLSVLSKQLKNYLRSNKPERHIHFDPAGVPVDTYQTAPEIRQQSLSEALESIDFASADETYLRQWHQYDESASKAQAIFLQGAAFSETTAFSIVINSLPPHISLHVGNSMPVRFAELLDVNPNVTTYCNRGTSGIDGCVSTSVGSSLVSEEVNVLLVGDLAFLYDRNAFLHNHPIPNLKIIVLNNQGGGIFRLIEGPSQLPELETYFETRHQRTAEYICTENSIDYAAVKNEDELKTALARFYEDFSRPSLIEIFTEPEINERVFKQLKKHIHEQIS